MGANTMNGAQDETVELWRHPNPEQTELYTFQQHVTKRHGLTGSTYHDLWKWSVEHPAAFWQEVWEYTGIKATKPPAEVGSFETILLQS